MALYAAVAAWLKAGSFGSGSESGSGPSMFPRLTAAALGMLAAGVLVRLAIEYVVGRRTVVSESDATPGKPGIELGEIGLLRGAAFFTALGVYVVLLPTLGFVVDSVAAVVLAALLLFRHYKSRIVAAAVGVAWTLLIYYAVVHGLQIGLPPGRL